jgi:hypothetical protein
MKQRIVQIAKQMVKSILAFIFTIGTNMIAGALWS